MNINRYEPRIKWVELLLLFFGNNLSISGLESAHTPCKQVFTDPFHLYPFKRSYLHGFWRPSGGGVRVRKNVGGYEIWNKKKLIQFSALSNTISFGY